MLSQTVTYQQLLTDIINQITPLCQNITNYNGIASGLRNPPRYSRSHSHVGTVGITLRNPVRSATAAQLSNEMTRYITARFSIPLTSTIATAGLISFIKLVITYIQYRIVIVTEQSSHGSRCITYDTYRSLSDAATYEEDVTDFIRAYDYTGLTQDIVSRALANVKVRSLAK